MALLAAQIVCLLLLNIFWPPSAAIPLSKAPTELSMLVSEAELSTWRRLANRFETEHPDIKITMIGDSDNTSVREGLYKEDFRLTEANPSANKVRYDLVFMDVIWIESFKNELVNLTGRVKADRFNLNEFLESEIDIGTDTGIRGRRLYRIPMYPDVGVLYYRKDLLDREGLPVPAEIEALKNAIEKVKASSEIEAGYLWQGDSYEGLVVNFFETMRGLGGQWIDHGQVKLTEEPARRAAALMKQLIQTGISPRDVTNYTETLSKEKFVEGKAIFLRGWPAFWPEIQSETSQVKGKVAIAPPFSFSPTQPGISCRGGWGFGISKNSAYEAQAWEAIKYFTSAEVQKEFVLEVGVLPSRKALFADAEIIEKYPFMPDMLRYLQQNSAFRPKIKPYTAVSRELQIALSEMLGEASNNEAVIRQVMEKAQQRTRCHLEKKADSATKACLARAAG